MASFSSGIAQWALSLKDLTSRMAPLEAFISTTLNLYWSSEDDDIRSLSEFHDLTTTFLKIGELETFFDVHNQEGS